MNFKVGPVFLAVNLRVLRLWGVVLFTFMGHFALAQTHALPEVDPAREWLGTEYADAIIANFKQKHPDIPLVLSTKDLDVFQNGLEMIDGSLLATGMANFQDAMSERYADETLVQSFVTKGKALLPAPLMYFANMLELGKPIYVVLDENSAEKTEQLKAWILAQPEHSIYPHEFMTESLRINRGHILAAWAMAWNIMSSNWGSAATRNYNLIQRKFVSLTGERHLWNGSARYVVLPEKKWSKVKVWIGEDAERPKQMGTATKAMQLVVSKRGDEFSYIYHRLGVELLALTVAHISNSAKVGWTVASLGALAEYFSYSTTAGLQIEKTKRIRNDLAAAKSGAQLYKLASGQKAIGYPARGISADSYLKSNYKKYGANYQLPVGSDSEYFGMKVDPALMAPAMGIEELRHRFYHAVYVDSGIFNPVLLVSNGDGERLFRGLTEYWNRKSPDKELNSYIELWLYGQRAEPFDHDIVADLELDEISNLNFARNAGATSAEEASRSDFNFEDAEAKFQRLLVRVISSSGRRVGPTSSDKPVFSAKTQHSVTSTLLIQAMTCPAALE